MAGLEVVVRPVVLPNIRPAPPQRLAPPDDPEKGVAQFGGMGGGLIDLAFSESSSMTRTKTVETQRQVDVERIYQKEPDPETGKETINKDNYVDVERVTKVWEQDGEGVETERSYAKPDPEDPERDNIEVLETDKIIKNPSKVGL